MLALLSQFKAIHVVVETAQINLILLFIGRLFKLRTKIGLDLLFLLRACYKTEACKGFRQFLLRLLLAICYLNFASPHATVLIWRIR